MEKILLKLKNYKLSRTKKWFFFLGLFIFLLPSIAWAGVGDFIAFTVADIFNLLTNVVGYILVFLLNILVNIAQYNSFISSAPVETGWKIVRDVCNMFFILILLVIAFATILRLDGYNWKKDLPRLLIYAVLINFSKTICGIMIDFSQVIMLTFINAVATNGANNLIVMFQVDMTKSLPSGTSESSFSAQQMVGAAAGFIAIIITTIMTIALLATLVMRIVYIWIYVILSPAAYLMNAFNGGKQYYSQWSKKFTTELTGGPVLAFFLWLALTVTNSVGNVVANVDDAVAKSGGNFVDKNVTGGITLFTNGPFQKYIIVIGLLYGGMQVASQIGGAAGKAASAGMKRADAVFDRTKKMAMAPVNGMKMAASGAAGFVGRGLLNQTGKILQGENPNGTGLGNKLGGVLTGLAKDKKDAASKARKAGTIKFLKSMGFGDNAITATGDLIDQAKEDWKSTKQVVGSTVNAMAGGNKKRRVADGVRDASKQTASSEFNESNSDLLSERNAAKAAADLAMNDKIANKLPNLMQAQNIAKSKYTNDLAPINQAKQDKLNSIDFSRYSGPQQSVLRKQIDDDFNKEKKAAMDERDLGYKDAKFRHDNIGEIAKKENDQDHKRIDDEYVANAQTAMNAAESASKSAEDQHKKDYEASKNSWQKDYDHKDEKRDGFIRSAIRGETTDKNRREAYLKAMGGGMQLSDMSKSDFYSGSGLTSNQEKLLKKMGDGSAESIAALTNINNQLRAIMQSSGGLVDKNMRGMVEGMKQGLAAMNKKGNSTTGFAETITLLNQTNTEHKTGKTTVKDFEDVVIV